MRGSDDDPAPEPGGPSSGRERHGWASSRVVLVALVASGGAAGTAARAALEAAVDAPPLSWPWGTFAVNVSGALALGLLLGVLADVGPDSGWRRRVRLTAGTGFLGGFTTYSTFAVEVVSLTRHAPLAGGTVYAASSVLLGSAAAAAGWVVGHRIGASVALRRTA